MKPLHRAGRFARGTLACLLFAAVAVSIACARSGAAGSSDSIHARVVQRVLIPNVPERWQAVAVTNEGDVLIAAVSGGDGRLIRVSRRTPHVTTTNAILIGTLAITADGRTCFPSNLGEITCVDRTGARARIGVPGAASLDQLAAVGNALFVLDRKNHAVFRVAPAGVRRIETGFPVLAFGAGPSAVALVGDSGVCYAGERGDAQRCARTSGLGAFGPADDAAATADSAVLIHRPDAEAVVIARDGSVTRVALPFLTQRIVPHDGASVWVVGVAPGGTLAVAAVSAGPVAMVNMNVRLDGGAYFLSVRPRSAVVVDDDLRAVLFLQLER